MKALAVATGIVFWTLVLGTAWLVFFPGSESGEPVAVLQIDPASVTSAPEPAGGDPFGGAMPPGQDDDVDLPPGFAVTGPAEAPMPPPPPAEVPAAPPELPQPDDAAPPSDLDEAAPPPTPDFDQQGALPDIPEAAVQTAASSHLEPPAAPETTAPALAPGVEQAVAPAASPEPEQAAALPASSETAESGSTALTPAPVSDLVEESPYGPLPKVALDGRRPAEAYARPSPFAKAAMGGPARIAVLLNGFGLPDGPSADVLEGLPAPVSLACGVYDRSLQELVTKVREAGHEVLLQIPLEPENYPAEDPGPHTLLTTLPPEENLRRLQYLMARYTGYVGVTNLMGARFETAREAFLPVLEEVKRRGLLYLDDGTAKDSAGQPIASTIGLEYAVADVRLDERGIAKGLAELETVARERGAAIGVAKAKAATVRQIADWADKLEAKGLVLVPVSAAVRSQRQS